MKRLGKGVGSTIQLIARLCWTPTRLPQSTPCRVRTIPPTYAASTHGALKSSSSCFFKQLGWAWLCSFTLTQECFQSGVDTDCTPVPAKGGAAKSFPMDKSHGFGVVQDKVWDGSVEDPSSGLCREGTPDADGRYETASLRSFLLVGSLIIIFVTVSMSFDLMTIIFNHAHAASAERTSLGILGMSVVGYCGLCRVVWAQLLMRFTSEP